MRRQTTEAGAESAVAVGNDNRGVILTSPTFEFNVAAPAEPRASVPRPQLLPPHASDFTGRESEISALKHQIASTDASHPPVVSVITGKPGVGKTTLAVHLAYDARDGYPDGTLYADLRGADERPAAPEEITGRFLRALGVPEQDIPTDPYARLDTYRRTVADRPLVILLDNASGELQVRPLLPPGNSALILVTSRSQLRGLEGVLRTDLDVFPTSTSLQFLKNILGNAAVEADFTSSQEVIDACGHLPLALRIAALRMSTTRHMRMADLAAELRDQRRRLESLEVGDLAICTAFNLSYRKLGKGAKNAFKRLSLVPGADFGVGLCSALMDCDERQAKKLLTRLSDANLIEPAATFDRFRFHDLLKEYSRNKAEDNPAENSEAAMRRMLDWLKNSGIRAHFCLISQVDKLGSHPVRSAEIDSVESARAWIDTDLANAVAAIPLLGALNLHELASQLSASLSEICEITGNWQKWEDVIRLGLEAAETAGEPLVEVMLMGARANLYRYRRDFERALESARAVYARAIATGNELAIATSANLLGCLLVDCGSPEAGMPFLEQSLATYRRLGNKHEIAKVLYNLGTIHRAAGNLDEAIDLFEEDLKVCREMRDESGAAETLNTLALAYSEVGRFEKAEELQRTSLQIFEKIGNPHKISMVCNDLALTLRHQNRPEEALALHLEDIERCRRNGNISGEALAEANAAEAFHILGNPQEAESRFNSAVSALAELKDDLRLARTLIGQVQYFFANGNTSAAEECANTATALLTARGELRDVVALHQVLAREYSTIADHEKSLTHAREAIRVGMPLASPYLRANSYAMALVASTHLGQGTEAREHARSLRSLAAKYPDLGEAIAKAYGDLLD
ncbi:tetratricopeptide (TPR) repeat protein [Kitasatospora sp. GP30]|uniref:ATP-binding protein n=1 Tax=Kitasatospora sp. GP30 TaxID=3035084 RepID=UPI000C70B8AD|nr:tetratricopeptide repeat protein [Kitasatospora sp. GP30]MDH6144955.1 tetratricopeptide (TPR) repeat protein [Kitasatospora sp. GP30]